MSTEDLPGLISQIQQANARWTAGETSMTSLADQDRKVRLGVVVNQASLTAILASAAPPEAPNFAPEVDWRNRNGNHVPPVEDQGNCGSCVSFCTCAVVSSMGSIETGTMVDLSEADLHFCSSHGANCGGWWPSDALESVRVRGVADEAEFPYGSAGVPNPHCATTPDRDSRAVKITQHGAITDVTARKNYLSNNGPCSAVLTVYADFYAYTGGVYHHVSGAVEGLHCVEVIGYSESQNSWICKNSWGTGWGNSGFFMIAYGECDIDTTYPFSTASGVQIPPALLSEAGVAAASWGPNRLDCLVRGTDKALWHRWWDGSWHNWESLGGVLTSGPGSAASRPNRLDIVVRGTDNALWHRWFDGSWHNWESLGGVLTSAPAAASWGPNRLDVFVRGTDNALWHRWFDGSWHNWESLGGVLSSGPGAASWGPNRLDVLVRGTDNALWHRWYDGAWHNWESLGGVLTSSPAAAAWGPNRLDIVVRGTDNALWHRWWDGSWHNWESLGGVITSAPGAAAWGPNRLDLLARGTDNALWHRWWDGSWHNWESLGGVLT
jgi:C1A family cysteine protease